MRQARQENEPILVTGMPRSGTTWLARLLTSVPGTALTGREPMNPRGRQYALAGTLSGWARVETLSRRQRRALVTSYSGINPWVYSKYGQRQWAAALPGVRLIVKDPFAMLSLPAVHEATGARSILVYRHPGAGLTSYRRMGWSPDLDELGPIVDGFLSTHGRVTGVERLPATELNEVEAMAWFWNSLYGMALHDRASLQHSLVVSHSDVAQGGPFFAQQLYATLGLRWGKEVVRHLRGEERPQPSKSNATTLHNFNRPPEQVAHEWQDKVTAAERALIEDRTAEVYSLLSDARYRAVPAHS